MRRSEEDVVQSRKDSQKLTAEERRKFKALLIAKRNEILGDVSFMEDEMIRKSRGETSPASTDPADMGSDTCDLDNALGLMASERKILHEIKGALVRIEDGTYGICELGGEIIPRPRLRAIPWARYCLACADSAERNSGPGHGPKKAYYIHEADGEEEEEEQDEPLEDADADLELPELRVEDAEGEEEREEDDSEA
jgi:DnaK suppressor protein